LKPSIHKNPPCDVPAYLWSFFYLTTIFFFLCFQHVICSNRQKSYGRFWLLEFKVVLFGKFKYRSGRFMLFTQKIIFKSLSRLCYMKMTMFST
jgi:hypothetical protein